MYCARGARAVANLLVMDETEARFQLLRDELAILRDETKASVGHAEQLRGWCITVTLAAGGYALQSGEVGVAELALHAVLAFYLLEANARAGQGRQIDRLRSGEAELRQATSVAEFLASTPIPQSVPPAGIYSFGQRLAQAVEAAMRPGLLAAYVPLVVAVAVVALSL